jgi:hypothetical protein
MSDNSIHDYIQTLPIKMSVSDRQLYSQSFNDESPNPKRFTYEVDLGEVLRQKSKVTSPDQCTFCKTVSTRYTSEKNDTILNYCTVVTLYEKYSSSQNYYYTKDVNDICHDKITTNSILFKDILCMLDMDEFLKRYYRYDEYGMKIKLLIEYYKFHQDIPRLFMSPSSHTMNKYHDKKRKMEYNRITKYLRDEA